MKNLILLFLIFFTITSCGKDADPKPDLAGKFAGNFYGTKTANTVITDETWKITKQDLTHMNVTFFFTNTYPDGSITRSKYDIYIPNVAITENNVLNFDSQFVADQLKYRIIGKAHLINDTLYYDITITSDYNSSKLSNKIYRR